MGNKHSLFMKSGQWISYSKINNFIKKLYKNCGQKTNSRVFCFYKDLSTNSIGK